MFEFICIDVKNVMRHKLWEYMDLVQIYIFAYQVKYWEYLIVHTLIFYRTDLADFVERHSNGQIKTNFILCALEKKEFFCTNFFVLMYLVHCLMYLGLFDQIKSILQLFEEGKSKQIAMHFIKTACPGLQSQFCTQKTFHV